MEQLIQELEDRIGYFFNNKNLLRQALTHSSTRQPDYDKLEFLGDAVLDLVLTNYLYDTISSNKVGKLAVEWEKIASEHHLSKVAEALKIAPLINISSHEEQKPKQKKLLTDIIEAILGAIYQDSGRNLRYIESFLHKHILSIPIHPIETNPKGVLKEWVEKRYKKSPTYVHIKKEILSNNVLEFTVELIIPDSNNTKITAKGYKKHEAEINAAKKALILLNV